MIFYIASFIFFIFFFFSSRRRHTRSYGDWSSDVCSSDLLALYRQMQLIRLCEERLAKSHQRGLVHGACHTYVGQEAIAVGVRSEERRVGKECRSRWAADHEIKKQNMYRKSVRL